MMKLQAALAVVAIVAGSQATAQAPADMLECLANTNPNVRGPCIRRALASSDHDTRSAALAAALAPRSVVVLEFDPPSDLVEFNKKIAAGTVRPGDMSPMLSNVARFVQVTGQQISLRVDSFDTSRNVVELSVRDSYFKDGANENDRRNASHGIATVSGDTLQFAFRLRVSGFDVQCSAPLILKEGSMLVGTLSCVDSLPRTGAQFRIF